MRNERRRRYGWALAAPLALWLSGCVTPTDSDDDDGRGGLDLGKGDEGSCSEEGQTRCDDALTLATCIEGTWAPRSCTSICGDVGFSANGCSEGTCMCDAPLNEQCAIGSQGFCACADAAGQPCTGDQLTELYIDCHQSGNETLTCFAGFVEGDTIDCAGAAEVCL